MDNYSESQVNDAVTITNRCTVDEVDTIAAAGAVYLQGMMSRGDTDMLLGRSFDLKSAYRQLAVSDDSLKWARLAVYDPHESATKLFQQYSLPLWGKGFCHCIHPVCQDDSVLSTQADDCCHLLLR